MWHTTANNVRRYLFHLFSLLVLTEMDLNLFYFFVWPFQLAEAVMESARIPWTRLEWTRRDSEMMCIFTSNRVLYCSCSMAHSYSHYHY